MGTEVQYVIFQRLVNLFFQADVPNQILQAAKVNQEQTVVIGAGTTSDQHTSIKV